MRPTGTLNPTIPDITGSARRWTWAIGLLPVLALGFLVYLPGLSGGYVFDDLGNLIDNPAFAPAALHAHFWHAIWSAHSGPLDRPLSMLSFAGQMAFTGLDPWPLKLANVLIHLLNGALVWLLSSRVLGWLEARNGNQWLVGARPQALLLTAAWVLAPIQLTAVLYVVQREESLAATFVLLGLLAYWHGRMRLIAQRPGALAWIWGSLGIGTVLAALAKETGVMLPAYAFVIEWIVLQGQVAPAAKRRGPHPLLPVFALLLFLPGILGLAWLLPGALNGSAYATRPFTLDQRLLTEGRVLVDYLRWIVLPTPNALSLYHDDIGISTGWFAPWTTAACWALLLALLGAALALRRRMPAFALGVLWFLAGQSLVSSFVPLELVYEHRNYLPDWGVFVALFALLLSHRPADTERRRTLRLLAAGGIVAMIALDALFTSIRAQVWGNPYRLAYFEATTHPQSPRAGYDLGRTMLMLAKDPGSTLFQMGMRQMEQAARLPGADLQPLQALIFMSAKNRLPVQPQWWTGMRADIAATPLAAEDIGSLYSLIQCGIDGVCHYTPQDLRQLGETLAFAVESYPARADLVTLQANDAANLAHDTPLAYRLMLRAVTLSPNTYDYWKNLVTMQFALDHDNDAANVIERMRELDRFGIHHAEIAALQMKLRAQMTQARGLPAAAATPIR